MDIAKKVLFPAHKVDLPVGTVCPNREPESVEEDVGLISATCPACGCPFVFSYKANSWVPEDDFESSLRANPPIIKGL
jgi:hypothetical protein